MNTRMNKYIGSLTLIVLTLFSIRVDAADRPIRIGVSGGQTRIENEATQQYQDATQVGVVVGVDLFKARGTILGAEIKYDQTTTKKDVTDTGTMTTSNYEAEQTGLFITGRTAGAFYGKLKLGAINRKVTVNDLITTDETKGAAGIGIGLDTGTGGVMELEYTAYSNNMTIFSINYLY